MTTLIKARETGVASAGGRFLRLSDVMVTTGLGRSTIYRMIANNAFPAQIQITTRSIGWWQADIDAWLQSRIAHRHAPS